MDCLGANYYQLTIYLLVFFLFYSPVVCSYSLPKACAEEDRIALLQFKNQLHTNCNMTILENTNDFDDRDCCQWYGVTCDSDTGHVIGLDFGSGCLHGNIDSNSSLFNLIHLQWLYLDGNNFNHSQISPLFGNLTSLFRLDLSYSNFAGQIPNSIFQLTKLEELYLRGNGALKGKIPSFQAMNVFWSLDLSECNFSGPIPESVGYLTQLAQLHLSFNHFSGKIPISLSKLENLSTLHLSSNNFEGPIPQSFGSLTSLNFLSLGGNSISGEFPTSLFNLVKLQFLNLSSNNLVGTVELDKLFAKLENLENLDLSNSGLAVSSTYDSTLSSFPVMTLLRLSSCKATKILTFLKTQDKLEVLDLSNNELSEELPPFICNQPYLQLLDLSNNKLYGSIPACFGNSSESLVVVKLQKNNFHGTIPQTIGYASILQTLDMSNNFLHGVLPRSLANCTHLDVLNLGHNLIADVFPFWMEDLPSLKVLALRDNKFYGPVGKPRKRSSAFANLRIIDLSHNDFMGSLPSKYFESWQSMMIADEYVSQLGFMSDKYSYYFDSMTIMNKGLEMVLVRILTIFTAVDFSHNKFHGEIPISIGRLKALHVLNFSGNSLKGHIPLSLGNLTELESLDLSQNKLSGEIPQQLTNLTFLAVFDISQNNLTGLIPRGKQFETFSNTSYEGNPGLCGFPLEKRCGNIESAEPTIPSHPLRHRFFQIDGFGWKAVALGYGCGVVVGVVIGSCIIRRKEEWILKFFSIKVRQHGRRSKKVR